MAVAVALSDEDPFVADREHLAAADQRVDIRMALGVKAKFDQRHILVLGRGFSKEWAHAGPGSVRPHNHVKTFGRAADKHVVAAACVRCDRLDLAPPPHYSRRKRIQQNPAQRRAVDLRPIVAGAVSVEQQCAVLVVEPIALILRSGGGAKLVLEPGGPHRMLASIAVKIERAALRPVAGVTVPLEYR
jgi:hypothetical protein